jgi:hypothetical protein
VPLPPGYHQSPGSALGDRYDQFLAEARNLDFDDTIAQLIRSQPAAH